MTDWWYNGRGACSVVVDGKHSPAGCRAFRSPSHKGWEGNGPPGDSSSLINKNWEGRRQYLVIKCFSSSMFVMISDVAYNPAIIILDQAKTYFLVQDILNDNKEHRIIWKPWCFENCIYHMVQQFSSRPLTPYCCHFACDHLCLGQCQVVWVIL